MNNQTSKRIAEAIMTVAKAMDVEECEILDPLVGDVFSEEEAEEIQSWYE